MKKFLLVSLTLSIVFVIGLIIYGAYLNRAGEQKIAEQIADYKIPVRVAKAEYRDINASIMFPALKFYSKNMVDVVTMVNGRITEMFVKKDDFVQEGQILCKIIDGEMPMKIRQAEVSIMDAEGQLQAYTNALERQRKLFAKDATSWSKVEEAEKYYNTAVAKLEDAKSKHEQLLFEESFQEVTAPISGIILTEYKNLGAGVNSGTPIFMIGDFTELFCDVTVPDNLARHLAEDTTVTFTFQEVSDQFYNSVGQHLETYRNKNGFSEKATIAEILPPLSEPAENRRMVWHFDNRARTLEPAIYGLVTLNVSKARNHLVIPENSLLDLKNPTVFVLDTKDNTIHLREISTGVTDNEYVEVVSGLSEGELVVTSSTKDLKDGSKVKWKE